jgi:hypothetical protein
MRSTLTCLSCSSISFRLSVVSYLITTAIWSYRLGRPTNWAWGSVANADTPLAYELAAALAFRGHLGRLHLRNRTLHDLFPQSSHQSGDQAQGWTKALTWYY